MDYLGRYYTEEIFSNLLVNQFSSVSPSTVVDLGVGGGALIKAAFKRWQNANYYAADIDKNSVKRIFAEYPFVKIINANSLRNNIANKLELKVDSVDIAVCNPPYLRIEEKSKYFGLFEEANMGACFNLKKVTSDVVFLAQNLRLLKKKGELGIILPDSLLTGHEFAILRESIINSNNIRAIIELPENIFPKTEAKTHILLLEKGKKTSLNTSLFMANQSGKCFDHIEVLTESLSHRMDFSYHKWNQKSKPKRPSITLNQINCEIKRGVLTHSELKQQNKPFIHTTSMKHGCSIEIPKPIKRIQDNLLYAQQGDILLARVGKRCIGKTTLVLNGTALLSDCVYRIRVPKDKIKFVWDSLNSPTGQNWLRANAHGVCAKVISKSDLLNFPFECK